jgi:hypothetical protein
MRKPIRLLATLAGAAVVALASGCGGGPEESAPSAGAPIPDGGLTIAEVLASTPEGPFMVKGYLIVGEGDEMRLCSALLESYPPQCGEPSLRVKGLDLEQVEGLMRPSDPELAQVAWTEEEISVLGEVEAGVITASDG